MTHPPSRTPTARRRIRCRGIAHSALLPMVLAAAAALSAGCRKPETAAPPPPVVGVMELAPASAPISTTLIGQLDSPQNVQVRARVEGFVERIHFTDGTEVGIGDLLFELDKKPFVERLAAAKGSLAEAQASFNKAEKDVERLTPLAERNAIPRQDLDNALAAVDVAKASIATATAKVQSAELDLGYCEIHAPVGGLIGATEVSMGELVGKGEPTLLATISQLDPIWFYSSVSEVDYMRSEERGRELGRELASVPLSLLRQDGREHEGGGRFIFIDRAVDTRTGTMRVRAEFPNSQKILRPGMFARVRVDIGNRENVILVPRRAVLELQGKSFVWVVSGDNTASQRLITTGESIASDVIVNEGLQAGERIIVEGIHKVRDGSPITPTAITRPPGDEPQPVQQ